jgi:hypothetical protein
MIATLLNEHYECVNLKNYLKQDVKKIHINYTLEKNGKSHHIGAKAFTKEMNPSTGSQDYFFENGFYGFRRIKKVAHPCSGWNIPNGNCTVCKILQ